MRNALVLFLVIAGLIVEAKDNKQQWKEYTFADDGFIVSLPAAVTPHKDSQDSNFNVYPIPLGTNSSFNLRTAAQSIDCGVFMRDLRQRLQDSMAPGYRPPIPGSFRQISVAGIPALQYEYKLNDNQTGFERYYCTQQKLYIFSVLYPANQPRPSDSDRILNSFRLIRGDTRPSGMLHTRR